MHHVIPIEAGTAACVLSAASAAAAAGCAIASAAYGRRFGVRRTALRKWIAEQTLVAITDGDALFDRWNEATQREMDVKRAQAARVLCGIGAAIHAALATVAGSSCL